MVVISDRHAAILVMCLGKQRILGGKIAQHGARQHGDIARCRGVIGVGQARCVVETRIHHAEPAGRRRHPLGKSGFAAADMFGQRDRNIIGALGGDHAEGIAHADRSANAQAQFRWRLAPGAARDAEFVVQLQPAGGHFLERNIERHHLGDGGRIADFVGTARIQNFAGAVVDQDGGIAGRGIKAGCKGRWRRKRQKSQKCSCQSLDQQSEVSSPAQKSRLT